jgi:hypothetical protein
MISVGIVGFSTALISESWSIFRHLIVERRAWNAGQWPAGITFLSEVWREFLGIDSLLNIVACILLGMCLTVLPARQRWFESRRLAGEWCFACGYPREGVAGVCPECGKEPEEHAPKKPRRWIAPTLVAALLFVSLVLFFLGPRIAAKIAP